MDQLINEVSQKTGLPQDQARMAVTAVINFIKDRLPPTIASQIDPLLSGSGVQIPDLSSLEKGIGGMFGGGGGSDTGGGGNST